MTRIELEAIPGAHKGTGSHTTSKLLVETKSVIPGNSKLSFVTTDVHITTMLYQIDAQKVPNWFGVAIPGGVTDFTKPTLYFHPAPSGGGYVSGANDVVYYGKSKDAPVRTDAESKWRELFQYVDRLGHQLAGAVKLGDGTPNQVVIVPFMTDGALLTGGILPDNWFPLFNDILADVRGVITGTLAPLEITELVVAGFSFGFSCVQNFRHSIRQDHAHLDPLMKQVWDFDGAPKTVSDPVVTVPGKFKVIKYSEGSETQSLMLPVPRWADCPTPPPDEEPPLKPKTDVHHMIRDFMFLDAACKRDKP